MAILYWIFRDFQIVAGFGMGASSIALFARVGGGIYTKAADVGADLVGKVEAGIPEDDPRNPATIADNVGDNVGDVAGMGADLFESYVGSIIATLALAATGGALLADKGLITLNADLADSKNFDHELFMLPILVAAVGIISSIVGTFLIRAPEGAHMGRLLWALRTGIFSSGALVLIAVGVLIPLLDLPFQLFWVILIGLVAGQIIGTASEVATSYEYSFTRSIAAQSETGPADGHHRRSRSWDAEHTRARHRGRDSHVADQRPRGDLRCRSRRRGDAVHARHHPRHRRLRPRRR